MCCLRASKKTIRAVSAWSAARVDGGEGGGERLAFFCSFSRVRTHREAHSYMQKNICLGVCVCVQLYIYIDGRMGL